MRSSETARNQYFDSGQAELKRGYLSMTATATKRGYKEQERDREEIRYIIEKN